MDTFRDQKLPLKIGKGKQLAREVESKRDDLIDQCLTRASERDGYGGYGEDRDRYDIRLDEEDSDYEEEVEMRRPDLAGKLSGGRV